MKVLKFMGKYKITSDSMNIILQEKQHNKKRNFDYWESIAFFSTPKNALDYIIDKEIKESWVDDLKLIVKKIDKLEKSIDGLNNKHLPEIVRESTVAFK